MLLKDAVSCRFQRHPKLKVVNIVGPFSQQSLTKTLAADTHTHPDPHLVDAEVDLPGQVNVERAVRHILNVDLREPVVDVADECDLQHRSQGRAKQ